MTNVRRLVLTFGSFKGRDLAQVPATYLVWMVTKAEKDQLYGNPWDEDYFKIGFELEQAARAELHHRGWTSKGLRWERPER